MSKKRTPAKIKMAAANIIRTAAKRAHRMGFTLSGYENNLKMTVHFGTVETTRVQAQKKLDKIEHAKTILTEQEVWVIINTCDR